MPTDPVAAVTAEQTATARSAHAALLAELPLAQERAAMLAAQVAEAEARWMQTETHSLAEAQSLELLRTGAHEASDRLEQLEALREPLERKLQAFANTEAAAHQQARAEELWTPMVARMMAALQELQTLLDEQERIKNTLVREGAMQFVQVAPLTVPNFDRFGRVLNTNVLPGHIAARLQKAAEAGYQPQLGKGKK